MPTTMTLNIDGSTKTVALAYIPRQAISMPSMTDVQTRIQQIKAQATQPANFPVAPQVVRRLVSPGVYQFRVQFMRDPNDPNYQGSTVLLRTPTATQLLQANGGNGPLVFTAGKPAVPTSLLVQANNINASSSTDFGDANSRALVLT